MRADCRTTIPSRTPTVEQGAEVVPNFPEIREPLIQFLGLAAHEVANMQARGAVADPVSTPSFPFGIDWFTKSLSPLGDLGEWCDWRLHDPGGPDERRSLFLDPLAADLWNVAGNDV